VVNSDSPDLTLGWATAYWQIMQILIVFFAAAHAINGVRVVIEDYAGQTWWRPFWRGLLFLIWLFILIVAVYVILAS
jgi:succinate dehydrogenase hydrophobic anchor subunit